MKTYDILNKLKLRFKGGGKLSLKPLIKLVINDDVNIGSSNNDGPIVNKVENRDDFYYYLQSENKFIKIDDFMKFKGKLLYKTPFEDPNGVRYLDTYVAFDEHNSDVIYIYQFTKQHMNENIIGEREVVVNGETYYEYYVKAV